MKKIDTQERRGGVVVLLLWTLSLTQPPKALEMASGDAAAAAEMISCGGGWFEACPSLRWNLQLLSSNEFELAKMLLDEGQMHLVEHWPEPGVDDDKKISFFEQVFQLNSSYPTGLSPYIQNARKLLADSKAGITPYDGFTPSIVHEMSQEIVVAATCLDWKRQYFQCQVHLLNRLTGRGAICCFNFIGRQEEVAAGIAPFHHSS